MDDKPESTAPPAVNSTYQHDHDDPKLTSVQKEAAVADSGHEENNSADVHTSAARRRSRNVFHIFKEKRRASTQMVEGSAVSDSVNTQMNGHSVFTQHKPCEDVHVATASDQESNRKYLCNPLDVNGRRDLSEVGVGDSLASHVAVTSSDNTVSAMSTSSTEKSEQREAITLHRSYPNYRISIPNGDSLRQLAAAVLLPLLMPLGIFYGLFSMLSSLPRVTSTRNYNNNQVYNTAKTFKPFGRSSPSMPSVFLPLLLPFMLIFYILRGILAPLELINKLNRRH